MKIEQKKPAMFVALASDASNACSRATCEEAALPLGVITHILNWLGSRIIVP